jgi:hypothetical protein
VIEMLGRNEFALRRRPEGRFDSSPAAVSSIENIDFNRPLQIALTRKYKAEEPRKQIVFGGFFVSKPSAQPEQSCSGFPAVRIRQTI